MRMEDFNTDPMKLNILLIYYSTLPYSIFNGVVTVRFCLIVLNT